VSPEVWISIFSTLLLGATAIWGDSLRRRLAPPRLDIKANTAPPDCVQIPIDTGSSRKAFDYFIRIRIVNSGSEAKHVEVYANELKVKDSTGSFKPVSDFLPMNLTWSYLGQSILPSIPRGITRSLDIAHVIDPDIRFINPNEHKVWPNVDHKCAILSFIHSFKVNSNLHLQPPGTYRLHLLITAENSKTIARCIEVYISGNWFNDPNKMYSDGIRIRVVNGNHSSHIDIFDRARKEAYWLCGRS